MGRRRTITLISVSLNNMTNNNNDIKNYLMSALLVDIKISRFIFLFVAQMKRMRMTSVLDRTTSCELSHFSRSFLVKGDLELSNAFW